jgi:predicted nucleotidyltransferase
VCALAAAIFSFTLPKIYSVDMIIEPGILNIRCRKAIKSIDPTAEVILYGSRARGSTEQDSDYDLLVLSDGDVTLEREDMICNRLYKIELETGAVITAFVYNRHQWTSPLYQAMPFHENVVRDGIIL